MRIGRLRAQRRASLLEGAEMAGSDRLTGLRLADGEDPPLGGGRNRVLAAEGTAA